MITEDRPRCWWVGSNPLMIAYHDQEWGYPQHDDRKLFEYLVLDTFQAGLSWELMLKKREGFRQAFSNFDAEEIARFDEADVARLLADATIVRNQAKIRGTINNARVFLKVQESHGSFDRYLWQFTDYRTLRDPRGVTRETMPTVSPEAQAMSKDMRRQGFKFTGPTICYAYMQAIGMIDDHAVECFRFQPG